MADLMLGFLIAVGSCFFVFTILMGWHMMKHKGEETRMELCEVIERRQLEHQSKIVTKLTTVRSNDFFSFQMGPFKIISLDNDRNHYSREFMLHTRRDFIVIRIWLFTEIVHETSCDKAILDVRLLIVRHLTQKMVLRARVCDTRVSHT
jgi:hypothetical protein